MYITYCNVIDSSENVSMVVFHQVGCDNAYKTYTTNQEGNSNY
jgi:hypothetical protein